MTRLILASSSPLRREILKLLPATFEVLTSRTDESVDDTLPPEEIVMTLACKKAGAVAEHEKDAFVIGADTIVVYENHILGKPGNEEKAAEMLRLLSGKTHTVYTGVCVVHNNKSEKFCEKTHVTFWDLSEEEIEAYIRTGEPMDKAGAYGIQGFGATLVKSIEGDYFSVVGLPVAKLYRTMKEMGYPFNL